MSACWPLPPLIGWAAAQRAQDRGVANVQSLAGRLLTGLPPHCKLATVIHGHPATLSWPGSVSGHQVVSLGVEHFGQAGAIGDLYRHNGIDAESIVRRVDKLTSRKPIGRHHSTAGDSRAVA